MWGSTEMAAVRMSRVSPRADCALVSRPTYLSTRGDMDGRDRGGRIGPFLSEDSNLG